MCELRRLATYHTHLSPAHTLFTGVRGRGILRSSDAGSCIDRPRGPRGSPLSAVPPPSVGLPRSSSPWPHASASEMTLATYWWQPNSRSVRCLAVPCSLSRDRRAGRTTRPIGDATSRPGAGLFGRQRYRPRRDATDRGLKDNPQRLRREASFSSVCGVSPVEASSGKVVRHRLNRGGNRDANRAL